MEKEEFIEEFMPESYDEDMYSRRHVRKAVDEDEMNADDAGFMEGYLAG